MTAGRKSVGKSTREGSSCDSTTVSRGRAAPGVMAGLPLITALCSILTACAGPQRQSAPTDDLPQAAVQVAAAELDETSAETSTSPRVKPAGDVVVPASFQDVGEAPTPTSVGCVLLSPTDHDFSMTLEQVLQHTLDHHPLLQARAHEIEAARARLVTASLLPNPRWVIDSESPIARNDATRLSTRLTFAFPTGRKRGWRMATREAGVSRSQAALARETELLLSEVTDAATEVLYLQELAALQGHLSELARRTAELVEGRFRGGTTSYTSRLRSQLDAAEIELGRLDSLGRLEQARVRLGRAAGLPPAPLVSLRGELVVKPIPAIPLELLLAEAARCRPELAESRAALLESQRRHSLACAEARPDVVFGPRVHNELGQPDDRVGARLSVDVPLFDRNQGQIAETAADIRTRCAILDATEINTLNDVAEAFVQLQAAQRQLDYHRTHVKPLVEQTETAVSNAAAEKVLAPVQLSELMEQLVQMRLEQLELRYLHARLRLQLELLLGFPLESLQGTD